MAISGRCEDGGASTVAGQPEVPFAQTEISVEAQLAARRVLASGWVTTGPETVLFEREFAEYVRAEHAVGVSSCTAAIELALRALRIPPGGDVLVPTMTFCGAAHAIVHAGLRPVLVDVDQSTAMPTPAMVAASSQASGRPSAMLVLHFAGAPAPVAELAEAAGLPLERVVEDAAHAVGTFVGSRPVGALSRAACFSFYATKNLPIGEGGMLTTDDAELAMLVRRARLHGMSADAWRRNMSGGTWRYTVDEPGLKANMTDVQAAIGRAQLRHLEEWQRRREAVATWYSARLRRTVGLCLPAAPADGRHAWHLYVVRVMEKYRMSRDELIHRLSELGVGTSVHFIPLHHMPYFRRAALSPPGGLPGADALFPRLLSLPMHPSLTESRVDRVCNALSDLAPPHSARHRRVITRSARQP
jgi:perosamine synthetase